jgi:hypothetical protein
MHVGALFLLALIPASEVRKTTWPSGAPREEFEVEVSADGTERIDGSYRQQAELLYLKPPVWSDLAVDAYYGYFASHAMHQLGEPGVNHAWLERLDEVIGGSQLEQGPERGSWNPVGVWDFAGGRVYATGMVALCLEARFRLARAVEKR